jgi:diguanylate cyclase (GGDEF)-like protein
VAEVLAVEMDIRAALRPAIAPAAIIAGAGLLLATSPKLPASLAGMKDAGPYFALALAVGASIWINRGRAFIAAVSLLAGYAGWHFAQDYGAQGFTARAVYTAAAVLVPANVLAALLLPERGVRHHYDYRWLYIGVLEVLLVAWIASAGKIPISGTAWHGMLDHWLLRSPPAPWLGRLVFAAALVAAIWRAAPRHSPLDVGLVAVLAAFFIACEWMWTPGVFATFVSAAGVVLLVALLQESHRMAYRDELTGLPGRRALQESLAALGPTYTIAMVDVDHFKKFNDTHGHDAGDQVLKLVAARLAEVQGGGRAFRYGGEEFTVLFPGQTLPEAFPHLERVRGAIESYKMAVRGAGRPKDKDKGALMRTDSIPLETLSVTVSIGVAGPSEENPVPAKVIKAADEALYRAKQGGRNRVSR